jgi:hypothetical protein
VRTLALVVVGLLSIPAAAQADRDDGLYGRFDGDLTLSAAVGAGLVIGSEEGDDDAYAVANEVRLRYLETAGVLLALEWHPSGGERFLAGLDLRPVFLWHFLTGAWSGNRFFDLLLGSIGIDLGFAIGPLGGAFDPGVAFAIGLGLDVPIAWGDSGDPGVFVRLGARHVRAAANDWSAPQVSTADWLLHAAVGMRFSIDADLATREPARYETPD